MKKNDVVEYFSAQLWHHFTKSGHGCKLTMATGPFLKSFHTTGKLSV